MLPETEMHVKNQADRAFLFTIYDVKLTEYPITWMLASKSPLYPTKQTLTRKISFGIGASIPANEPARGGRVVRVLLQQVVHLQRHFRYGSWVVGADGLVEAARRISPFHYTCGNK